MMSFSFIFSPNILFLIITPFILHKYLKGNYQAVEKSGLSLSKGKY